MLMETQRREAEELLSGQAEIWRLMFAYADSMAVKSAVELRIPDIIHAHPSSPITLSQIASSIDSPSPDTSYLHRIMRLLVRRNLFTAHQCDDPEGTTLYGPTPASRWLLLEGPSATLAPMFLMQNHPWLVAPWHSLGTCVREGGVAFEKAHVCGIWDFAEKNPEFNRIFNDGMACTANVVTRGVLIGYGSDGFGSLGSLVDVGGGTGTLISEIVKSCPHIKGINFDLPHVVATAPEYRGVEHRGGDMFHEIPNADAVIMKEKKELKLNGRTYWKKVDSLATTSSTFQLYLPSLKPIYPDEKTKSGSCFNSKTILNLSSKNNILEQRILF